MRPAPMPSVSLPPMSLSTRLSPPVSAPMAALDAAAELHPLSQVEQTLWLQTVQAEAQRVAESGESPHNCRLAAIAAANLAVRAQRQAAPLPPAEDATIEQLVEFANSQGLSPRVDRHGGRIFGVKVLGLASRNGRRYQPEVVAAAAPLYEGVKVNVNHPKGRLHDARDYQDRLGCLRHVRATAAGLFGDLYFNPRHPLAEQLMWDAEHAPENVGLSHNVQARCRRQGDELLVEAIESVNSVDLVADPATTRGLFEAAPPAAPFVPAAPSPDELQELRARLAALEAWRQTVLEGRLPHLLPLVAPQSRGPHPPREPLDVAQWARSIT